MIGSCFAISAPGADQGGPIMRMGALMSWAALVALSSTPAVAQTATNVVSYLTRDFGAFSVDTVDGTGPMSIGYGRVQPASSTAPAGFAILDFRQNNVLVSETA